MPNNISIANAHIFFRNFSGKGSKFNPEGRRNFCVEIDPSNVDILQRDGWNIKYLRPRDPEDDPTPYLQVSVTYGSFPPKIYMISGNRVPVELDENSVGTLDFAEIENVDLIIRPYSWEVNGKAGVKAYVKKMYCTLAEDEFEAKYFKENETAAPSQLELPDDLPF